MPKGLNSLKNNLVSSASLLLLQVQYMWWFFIKVSPHSNGLSHTSAGLSIHTCNLCNFPHHCFFLSDTGLGWESKVSLLFSNSVTLSAAFIPPPCSISLLFIDLLFHHTYLSLLLIFFNSWGGCFWTTWHTSKGISQPNIYNNILCEITVSLDPKNLGQILDGIPVHDRTHTYTHSYKHTVVMNGQLRNTKWPKSMSQDFGGQLQYLEEPHTTWGDHAYNTVRDEVQF